MVVIVKFVIQAADEKGFNLEAVATQGNLAICLDHAAERALAFELLQFGDVLESVLADLLLNRLCDYLKEVCVKFTDFVTKCHVLNASGGESEVNSRLLLCEATRRVMAKCFELLGIDPLERI
jgi:arginyl-tRNA synthetase